MAATEVIEFDSAAPKWFFSLYVSFSSVANRNMTQYVSASGKPTNTPVIHMASEEFTEMRLEKLPIIVAVVSVIKIGTHIVCTISHVFAYFE